MTTGCFDPPEPSSGRRGGHAGNMVWNRRPARLMVHDIWAAAPHSLEHKESPMELWGVATEGQVRPRIKGQRRVGT